MNVKNLLMVGALVYLLMPKLNASSAVVASPSPLGTTTPTPQPSSPQLSTPSVPTLSPLQQRTQLLSQANSLTTQAQNLYRSINEAMTKWQQEEYSIHIQNQLGYSAATWAAQHTAYYNANLKPVVDQVATLRSQADALRTQAYAIKVYPL